MEQALIEVADGAGFFPGRLFDVSRYGFCIADLPKHLNVAAETMTAIVSGKESHFTMTIRPKWYIDGSAWKIIGVEIINPPWDWKEFVMGFEPAPYKCIWTEVHL